jgi:hypothetical protein
MHVVVKEVKVSKKPFYDPWGGEHKDAQRDIQKDHKRDKPDSFFPHI